MTPEQLAIIGEGGWTLSQAFRAGRHVANVFSKGSEIHLEILDARRAMTRKNTLEFLKPIFDEYGYVTTRVPLDETEHRLRDVLGFKYMWSDNEYSYWCLTELPFQKVQQ